MLDNQNISGYNMDSDDINGTEIVRMDEHEPINDPDCEHVLRKDETDRIGDTVAWMCIKPKCGFGQFLPDDETLIQK